jgi:hypothetical protein
LAPYGKAFTQKEATVVCHGGAALRGVIAQVDGVGWLAAGCSGVRNRKDLLIGNRHCWHVMLTVIESADIFTFSNRSCCKLWSHTA